MLGSQRIPGGEAPSSVDVHEASASPIPLMEPMIAMVVSTSMGRDQRMGAVHVSSVTALMKILDLEAPQWQ